MSPILITLIVVGILLLWVILLIIFASTGRRPAESVLNRAFPIEKVSLAAPLAPQVVPDAARPIIQEAPLPAQPRLIGNVVPHNLLPKVTETYDDSDSSPTSITPPRQFIAPRQSARPPSPLTPPRPLRRRSPSTLSDTSDEESDSSPRFHKPSMGIVGGYRLKKKNTTSVDSDSFTSTEEVKRKMKFKKSAMTGTVRN